MTSIPAVQPPIRVEPLWVRHLPQNAALGWLAAGWRDTWRNPIPSLAYGLLVMLVSLLIVGGLFGLGWDFVLLPALAGFMVMGPLLAIGLYEKSRRLAAGEPVSLTTMGIWDCKTNVSNACQQPLKLGVPSGCMTSCKGLQWTIKAEAAIDSQTRKIWAWGASSNWAIPMLLKSET